MADLTGELRAWPHDTWAKLGVDPDQVAQAVIGCWQDGEVTGLQVDDLGFEEARSLARPAMTSVRGQLRGRLADTEHGSLSAVSGTWTPRRRAAAEVSGDVRGRITPVPAWAAGMATPTGHLTMLASLEGGRGLR